MDRFQQDTKNHVLTVFQDTGLYRNMRWASPTTGVYSVTVTTWPDRLCITGDMGDWVFSRLNDMFVFFRRPDNSYTIDYTYFAEKCTSADTSSELWKFSPNAALEFVYDVLDQVIEDKDCYGEDGCYGGVVGKEAIDEARERLKDSFYYLRSFDEMYRVWENAFDDESNDLYEKTLYALSENGDYPNLRELSTRFKWICRAIIEVIKAYDKRPSLDIVTAPV